MSAGPPTRTPARIPLLRETFGEPARMPESFARAVGPATHPSLAMAIGPREPRGSAHATPLPHPPAPRSAPRPGAA